MALLMRMKGHLQQNSKIITRVLWDLRFLIAGFLVTGYGISKIVHAVESKETDKKGGGHH